ncbi:MAG: ATP-dependent zinc metalloprotease FtsH [Phycisphaerae bacterium]|nr:ATP-dependent zinc metalloprotease FtsH [Phycisphaerae bacterium]
MNDNPSNPNSGDRPSGPTPRISRGIFGWVVCAFFVIMLLMLLQQTLSKPEAKTITELYRMLEAGEVEKLVIRDTAIEGTRKLTGGDQPNVNRQFKVEWPALAVDSTLIEDLNRRLREHNPEGTVKHEPSNTWLMSLIAPLLTWGLLIAFLYFFVLRPMRGAGSGMGMLGNFGRSRHKVNSREGTRITFADVAGVDEAKEEVSEIVEFLRNPRKFQHLGGRIPRGVLLVGDPGCGKTLLAKAIAGEADVPFFSISGSDFVEMFVGVGASRVRDLFKQAKENSPCIIFLDEIDAVGRRRGAGFSSGGHDEREQTLNAILVEMDGFETNDQIIVIAATNRVDVLDPALIRPGRFDRQVVVPMPDVKGRYEILKVHARKIKTGPDVDLQRLARATPGFSGADLAAVINESALLATMENKDFVEMVDLEEARDKVRWGRARKNRVIDEKDRIATAYHEAGHALVQVLLAPNTDPVHKVTILPRGNFGGATFSLPEQDRHYHGREWMKAQLRVLCAGRLAEELFRDDVNSGVASDIRQATHIAKLMVTEFGMVDEIGFVHLGEEDGGQNQFWGVPGGRNYSEETARKIDTAVKQLIDEAYADARQLLNANKDKLDAIAQALLKHETLDGHEVQAIIRGEALQKPTLGDLLDDQRSKPNVVMARPATPPPPTSIGPGPLPQPG